MKHLGLFEGIGGFSLAARWMGWETTAWVEIDPFCQKVLAKNFPNAQGFGNIKEFDATPFSGAIDIITGGFPCQPFSLAGDRKGNADDRALWYEMFRVICEVKPRFVVAENVPGLLSIEGGMVFEQVCLNLENQGYQVQAVVVPACAKDAPHKRDRVWIIAHNSSGGCDKSQSLSSCSNNDKKQNYSQGQREWHTVEYGTFGNNSLSFTANTKSAGPQARPNGQGEVQLRGSGNRANWVEVATQLCRMDDGLSPELDKIRRRNRNSRIKALGNSIVPQVAYEIFKALV